MWMNNKEREIMYRYFTFDFNLMFKWQICYTEIENCLHFAVIFRNSHKEHKILA
jgi:hypothetical protein